MIIREITRSGVCEVPPNGRYPCLSLHGIEGVFSDPGQKTVIPHRAVLKFSIRLVPGMEPAEVGSGRGQD